MRPTEGRGCEVDEPSSHHNRKSQISDLTFVPALESVLIALALERTRKPSRAFVLSPHGSAGTRHFNAHPVPAG
jgi:hypothetical protein